jgi:hypothetical protein
MGATFKALWASLAAVVGVGTFAALGASAAGATSPTVDYSSLFTSAQSEITATLTNNVAAIGTILGVLVTLFLVLRVVRRVAGGR